MRKSERQNALMPAGQPRYVRCYDNGGLDVDGGTIDRYTVVFTGRYKGRKGCDFVSMNAAPFHPQGFGQHGWDQNIIDVNKWGFPPAMGRRLAFGKRIPFSELPADCQKLVISDYKSIWGL